MAIVLLGTNLEASELTVLEQLHMDAEQLRAFSVSVKKDPIFKGMVALMTCNRIEWYIDTPNPKKAEVLFCQKWAAFVGIKNEVLYATVTLKQDHEAITHLFEVVCGLKSMVFGENEILGQVKKAHQQLLDLEATSSTLNKVFQLAVKVGKRVRHETHISRGAYSVSSIAIEAVRERVLEYFGCRILIVGAGEMGQRTIKKWAALGHPDITLCTRTEKTGRELCETYALNWLPITKLAKCIGDYEIIMCVASVKKPLIKRAWFNSTSKTRCMIDLGVPRNMDREIALDTTITVLSIAELKDIAAKNIKRRQEEISLVYAIIEEELKNLQQWFSYKKQPCPVFV